MAKRVFYSFHYEPDNWRASQVRNIGVVEGNEPVKDNDWETVTKGGEKAIEKWIDEQLDGRSCTIVLAGQKTADRKWIDHEIKRSWQLNKGVVGICIHNLKDKNGNQSLKGNNPFANFKLNGTPFSNIVKLYDPPYADSKAVYDYIVANLSYWVDEAVRIRNQH